MKKILLLLLLAVSFTAVGQKTYSIDRQLQLENVVKGIKKDSVLVRGSDKIVRYIPRSEFGSSQNLDQTLTNGSTSNKAIELVDRFNPADFSAYYTSEGVNIISERDYTSIGADGFQTNHSESVGPIVSLVEISKLGNIRLQKGTGEAGTLTIEPRKISFENSTSTSTTNLKFTDLAAGTFNQTFQAKTGEIALLSDITGGSQNLQQVTENEVIDGTATTTIPIMVKNESGSVFSVQDKDAMFIIKETGQDEFARVGMTISEGQIYTSRYGNMFRITPTNFLFQEDGINVVFSMSEPITSSANITFKPKTGVVAFEEDLENRTVINTTTLPLSANVLNSTYSNVTAGLEVIAASISGGGLIYKKTSTGWLQYSVTPVP
jgi:hypothetical protein